MPTTDSFRSPDFLIFIRHGQTDWNAEQRLQGRKDIPLNALGESQAQSNGQRLGSYFSENDLNPDAFRFVASPLGRTRRTMELLREGMNLPASQYDLEQQLVELTFGDWEGCTLEELSKTVPDLVQQRLTDKWGFAPPGGGESYEMLTRRITGWLETVSGPSVVVAHGGVFRALRGILEEHEQQAIPMIDTPQDKVFIWRDGAFSVI